MKVSMARIDQAGWRDPVTIARFRELPDFPLDEFQRRQLRKLLTGEMKGRNALLFMPRSSGKSAI
jgi:hypothetical protein